MFASKYGNKFPLNLTGASATNPVASNSPAHSTTDRAIPRPTITPAPTPGSAPQATFAAVAPTYPPVPSTNSVVALVTAPQATYAAVALTCPPVRLTNSVVPPATASQAT